MKVAQSHINCAFNVKKTLKRIYVLYKNRKKVLWTRHRDYCKLKQSSDMDDEESEAHNMCSKE